MSGGFLGVAHASRLLASASSRGAMTIAILLPIVVSPPKANGPAEYLCAFFAGFVRCIVKFSSDQQ
jgi:hypothetical protein